MTGDGADFTDDPIVNLRDAHLVEIYLHRTSLDRRDHLHANPGPPAHGRAATQVEVQPGSPGALMRTSA